MYHKTKELLRVTRTYLKGHFPILTCLKGHFPILTCLKGHFPILTCLKGHFPILTCLKEKLKSKGSFSGVEEAHTEKTMQCILYT